MADDRDQLQQTLDQLHEQLQAAQHLDAEVAGHLKQTIAEIDIALKKRGLDTRSRHSFLERLGDASRHFEESHPTLAGTLSRLVDILAQMGI